MAGSSSPSPSRRPPRHWASGSPQRTVLEDILADDRNSEARHRILLETAKREHERVREDAHRVYQEQLQREERQRLLEERRKQELRIRMEEQLAAERAHLNALKAKKIAIPAPLPDPEPPAPPAVIKRTLLPPSPQANVPAKTNGTTANQGAAPLLPAPGLQGVPGPGAPAPSSTPAQPQAQALGTAVTKAPEPARPANSVLGINGLINNPSQPNGVASTSGSVAPSPAPAQPDRYTQIHKNLKILRRSMVEQAKQNPALKERMGDMRREIRKCVGQLTVSAGVAGVNKTQVCSSFTGIQLCLNCY